jgi:diguanylate cyclase (GGDEF)-like protein/PAS domain S-box-containing protein
LNEDFYASVIRESAYGFAYCRILCDAEGRPSDYLFLDVNPALVRSLGLEGRVVVGKTAKDLFPELAATDPELLQAFFELGMQGGHKSLVHYFKPLSRWLSIKAYSKEPMHVVQQFVDITRDMDHLVRHENIFKLSMDLLCVTDLQGRLLTVNDEWSLVLGYTKSELLGLSLVDMVHPADLPKTLEVMEALGKSQKVFNFINRYRHKDGTYRSLEWRSQPEDGLIYAAARDVTQKLLMERRLGEKLEQLNLLFSQSLTGMFFMMLDEPVEWHDGVDKEAVLDYVFKHQRVTHVNQAFLDQYGQTEEEMLGSTPTDTFKHDMAQGRAVWRKFFDEGNLHIDTDERRKDGSQMWVLGDYTCMYDSQGRITGHFGTQVDITDRKLAEKSIQEYQQVLQDKNHLIESILDNAPLGIWLTRADQTRVFENRYVRENFQLTATEFASCETINQEVMVKDGPQQYEQTVTFKDQQLHTLQTLKSRIATKEGEGFSILGIGMDITERKNALQALRRSEEKYRLITEQASDVIWVLNTHTNRFTYLSPSIRFLTGYTDEETMRMRPRDMIPLEYLHIVGAAMRAALEDFKSSGLELKNHMLEMQHFTKNGDVVWVEASFRLRYGEAGVIEAVGVTRNIDERKRIERDVLYLSYHDQLTGLFNRRYYDEQLLWMDREENLPLTLVIADINGLKLTNDVFGHLVGDNLLKTFAKVLHKSCRPGDVAVRIGGDEFVLMLPKTDAASTQRIIDSLNMELSRKGTGKSRISVSFGSRSKLQMSESMEMVFKQAEDAMYSRKFLESNSYKHDTIKLITSSLFEKGVNEQKHGERVAELCKLIGSALGLDSHSVHELELAGLLHDIGKIGIDESLINKPGPLDENEWHQIRRHPEIGYEILRSVHEFTTIAGYVLAHHERLDGTGYPRKLRGEDICLQARVIAVADAFDTITNHRKYKDTLAVNYAIQELKTHAGTQFDPLVAKVFVEKVLRQTWE